MKTNKINAANMVAAFGEFNKSFNAAIRFIFDLSKEAAAKVPAAPAKDDDSGEAKNLRKEIKAAEKKNAIIADAKKIIAAFNVTANDIKSKGILDLRDKIMARVPAVDENGRAVKFIKLPAYLKIEIKDYSKVFQVIPASWIESICMAADSEKERGEGYYNVTTPPVIADGVIDEVAHGDLVNERGHVLADPQKYEIFDKWEKEAKINNISAAAGRETAKMKKAELKSSK